MDLFEYMRSTNQEKESPLAARLRPSTLDEVVGQQHIIGKDKLLYRAIKADKLSSIIFYGPPGTGKTTLARVIANTTSAEFTQINATVAGKKDMEAVVEKAKDLSGMYGKKTILFIDEIHRFNKGQQDYLLPFVEDGTLILIGATTENPYFEVNGALISRSVIFELHPLSIEDIKALIQRAVYDRDKGMGAYEAVIDEEAVEFLAELSGGDARHALNAVELGIMTTNRGEDGKIHITLAVAQECIQKRVLRYDKSGDSHYDTISAFIKSMRGSDPDAAVYYLGRMLYAGESATFIARRIMICAGKMWAMRIPWRYAWRSTLHWRWREWGCRKHRSFCRRRYPMWPVRRRATLPVMRSFRRWRRCGRPGTCLFRRICRMPITEVRRNWVGEQGTNMRMIIRTITLRSSTCLMN